MLKLKMWVHTMCEKFLNYKQNVSNKTHTEAMRVDEDKLNNLLHYPIKPAAIPLVSVESLYNRHEQKISQIKRNIGLVETGAKFNSNELVEDIIKKFISYCHLLPASEMDHHQYVGGLLEHSLDVSLRSLQAAIGSMLDEQGLIDEDQLRRPRYEYAAWLCGLLHDTGKIISNLTIIEPSTGKQWQPLHSNLYDWCKRESFDEYTVLHNKDRIHHEHETNSIHFLSLILNDATKEYLLSGPDDLYSKITQTLIGYHSNKGYLHNAVRIADGASTYNDYARVWRHDSHRDKAMVTAVVDVIRSLYFDWTANTPTSELFILNGEIYIDMVKPFKDVISKCQSLKIAVPSSPKSLIEILIEKRIMSKVADKTTFGQLYFGKFTADDIHEFNDSKKGPLAKCSPKSVIKFTWANFAIGDNPIPDNCHAALRYNSKKADNTHTLFALDTAIVVLPKTQSIKAEDQPAIKNEPVVESSNNKPPATVEKLNPNVDLPAPTKVKTKRSKKSTAKPSVVKQVETSEVDNLERNSSINQTDLTNQPNPPAKKPTQNSSKEETDCVIPKTDKTSNPEVKVAAINRKPSWINKRPLKPIDSALQSLIIKRDQVQVFMDNGVVIVSVTYLAGILKQKLNDVIQELEYLEMLDSDNTTVPKRMEIDGKKVRVAPLAQVVAREFSYIEQNKVTLNQIKAPISELDTGTNTDIAEVETAINPEKTTSNELETGAHHRELITLKNLIQEVKTKLDIKSLNSSEIRPYLITLKIKNVMGEGGSMCVDISHVEKEELMFNIQKGIMNEK